MAENLKTTKYRNGDEIGTTTNTSILNYVTSKFQWTYNGDENNAAKYGRLYTLYTVADTRNIAPEGWHITSNAEWTTLENFLIANGYNYDSTPYNRIAKALTSTTDWSTFTGLGTIGNDLTKITVLVFLLYLVVTAAMEYSQVLETTVVGGVLPRTVPLTAGTGTCTTVITVCTR